MHRSLCWFAGLLVGTVLGFPAAAQTLDRLPNALRDWVDWARHGYEYLDCPLLVSHDAESEEGYACSWPGGLDVEADDSGARFSLRWTVYARRPVPLPGAPEWWPQDVSANGAAVPVVPDENGMPVVWLEPGTWSLAGKLQWVRRPESLRIPDSVALVRLQVDGKAVFPLQRQGDALWFGRAESAPQQADSLTLEVFRRLRDGVPAFLTTRIVLNVSGEGREEVLGKPLPQGFQPTALASDLPARMDPDGTLTVQVRPGSHAIVLEARAEAPLAKVQRPAIPAPWPTDEVWSYEADARLRVANATAARVIDPSQAGVPGEWAQLPAFLLAADEAISIEERSRGLSAQDQNRLGLAREMWLAFDGSGFDTRDRITGRMVRDWRLDVAAPYVLRRASESGEGLLVTKGAKPELTGVEVRARAVDVQASTRIARGGGSLAIAGWQQSFDGVQTTLNLPPGYRLYAALGADHAPEAWFERWDLLDVFLVALTSLLAAWLLGRGAAVFVLAYLVLAYHEPGAPLLTLLATVVLALFARVLPAASTLARVVRGFRNASLLLLVVLALPFVAAQVRLALYPQLERYTTDDYSDGAGGGMFGGLMRARQAEEVNMALLEPPPPAPPAAPAPLTDAPQESQSVTVTGSRVTREAVQAPQRKLDIARDRMMRQRYAANTIVQAGAGEPAWRWNQYTLSWSGPVLATQDMRLLISPPWLTRLLRLVVVALIALVLARLARNAIGLVVRWPRAGAAALVLGLALPGVAWAEATPAPELLEELAQLVREPPKCAPNCAYIAGAEVSVEGDEVRVVLDVAAAERAAIPLPGAETLLAHTAITVDGTDQDAVLRRDGGDAWIVVPRGVHRVALVFAAARADKIPLRFPMRPAQLVFQGTGWEANGLRELRLLTDTLELVRVREDGEEVDTAGIAQQFPPFVRVVRRIALGIDWEVTTQVIRVAPDQAAFSVRVPLIPGERVLTSDLKVTEGQVTVPLQAGEGSTSWSSRLERAPAIKLTAPDLGRHAEAWVVEASPMWNLRHAGVPPVHPPEGEWVHEFHPLPGETLELSITRPAAVAGRSLAIDGASLTSQVGKRAAEHTLELELRSTQGGQHVIALPREAEVLEVVLAGEVLNVRPEEGKLSLPIKPGTQQARVRWRETADVGAISRTPAVALNAHASNLRLNLDLPEDRWLLHVAGPRVGPAVLYWSELLVMILVAVVLARLRRTPLGVLDWLLLGIGFSTFSWWALLVVVAWLLALDARGRSEGMADLTKFRLAQLGLAILTVVALLGMVAAIPMGLLGTPDMHVAGNGSTATALRWFHDQTASAMPQGYAWSLPLWVYKGAMLAWALWLANALVKWLRWGWEAYSRGGYWRSAALTVPAFAVEPAPTTGEPAP